MWYACPIVPNFFFEDSPIAAPVNLAAGISIEPVPDWIRDKEVLEFLSPHDRKNVERAEVAFTADYQAEALGSPDPDWTGKTPRPIQSRIEEKFARSSMALWLTKPSTLTCGPPLLHFERKGDPHSLRSSASINPILIQKVENDNVPTSEDLTQAGKLLSSIQSLRRDGSVQIALTMLLRSLTERVWETRYLLQWIVLEALFGPDSPNEKTHRLSQRIALFLRDSFESRLCLFDEVKKAYAWRSKIVHGARLGSLTPEKSGQLSVATESILRSAFVKILLSPEFAAKFNSKDRDNYLDSLVFEI